MKTTLDIPDPLFYQAKDRTAELGIPLKQFVTEAIKKKLGSGAPEKPWMRMAGGLQHLHRETTRINRLIEQEFERID